MSAAMTATPMTVGTHPTTGAMPSTALPGAPIPPARALSGKQRRDLVRLLHLAATLPLGAVAYGPPSVALGLRAALQWVLFPALALTGTWMWQGPRLTRWLRTRRGERPTPAVSSRATLPTAGTFREGASRRSLALLALATGLGLLHHADHVLRADRSGWPFTPHVTAFTFSLLVYPLLAVAYTARGRPRVSAALVALVFLAAQGSHTFIEHPHDQYAVWATGVSRQPWAVGQPNLLHVQSPLLGAAAVALAITLSLVLLATAASFLADARAHASRAPEPPARQARDGAPYRDPYPRAIATAEPTMSASSATSP